MAFLRAGTSSSGPIEKFKPTNGFIIGYTGMAMCAVAVVYTAVAVHTLTGLRVGLGFALGILVVWVSLLRPRAAAYPGVLRLSNSLSDIDVPLVLIDDVNVRQTLNVWVGTKRYVCTGIGRSRQRMLKTRRPGITALLGMERLHAYAEDSNRPSLDQSDTLYESYVVTRVEELVDEARKAQGAEPPRGQVLRLPAWPEIFGLAVLAIAFVVSLLV